MSIVNSMETQEVFITHQMPTGTTFGIRVDNNENVFINAKLAKKHAITEEEVRTLILIPNANNNPDTPWQAVGVSGVHTEPTPRVEVVGSSRRVANPASLEDRIVEHFQGEDNQVASTSKVLADALEVDVMSVQTALTRMHNAGGMTKAQVHCKGGQDKASWVLWAPNTEWYEM